MTQSSALFSAALALLRQTQHGVLATQSLVLPGYPHASWLPFVLDEAGRIVLGSVDVWFANRVCADFDLRQGTKRAA
ncbi:hypothetical protein [Deefgea sp. CFH1-16]|uniref:hypothetical protein n=1 Tax=Deefgea sp. CFH1-16 TaxID=2675457 RepID=UPI0019402336|nr:hypothetical protein [Deefgea sp. CFH1-16]